MGGANRDQSGTSLSVLDVEDTVWCRCGGYSTAELADPIIFPLQQ